MDTLKDIKPKERMTEIGKLWSEQPVEKKEEYKQKANERNAEAVIKFNEAKVKEAENVEAKTEVAE